MESNDDPAARITDIESWTWDISVTDGANVVQQAITDGSPADELTLFNIEGDDDNVCTESNAESPSQCKFTTLFSTAMYDAIGVGSSAQIGGDGMVKLLFNGQTRHARMLLRARDTFDKGAAVSIAVNGRTEESTCDCSGGLFFIICWFFNCLLWIFLGWRQRQSLVLPTGITFVSDRGCRQNSVCFS